LVFSFWVSLVFLEYFQTRTVQVKQLSDLATEREIHEFFSFSGEIEHIQIVRWVISIQKFNFFFSFYILIYPFCFLILVPFKVFCS